MHALRSGILLEKKFGFVTKIIGRNSYLLQQSKIRIVHARDEIILYDSQFTQIIIFIINIAAS